MLDIDERPTIYVNKFYQKIRIGITTYQLSDAEITLLMLLLEAKGKLITKDVLLSQGWAGRVVSPTSLPVAIKHIRDMLKNAGYTDVLRTVKNSDGGYFILADTFNLVQLAGTQSIEIVDRYQEDRDATIEADCKINHDYCVGYMLAITLPILVLFFFIYNICFVYKKDNVISNTPISPTLTTELEAITIKNKNSHLFISNNGAYLVCDEKCCYFVL